MNAPCALAGVDPPPLAVPAQVHPSNGKWYYSSKDTHTHNNLAPGGYALMNVPCEQIAAGRGL